MSTRVKPLLSASVALAAVASLFPEVAAAQGQARSKKTGELDRKARQRKISLRANDTSQRPIRPVAPIAQQRSQPVQRPPSIDIQLPNLDAARDGTSQAMIHAGSHAYQASIHFRPFRFGRKRYRGVRLIIEGTADVATLGPEELEAALEHVAVAYDLPFAAAQLPDGRAVVAARPHRRHKDRPIRRERR